MPAPQPNFNCGERVKVLPGHDFPPTKQKDGIRYGNIGCRTNAAGMWIPSEDRNSKGGEWCYTVYFSPNAGASWWTENKIRKVRTKKPLSRPHGGQSS